MLANKRILVTGGAGFIGSALIWALNRRGLNNILVEDNLNGRGPGNVLAQDKFAQSEKWKNLVPLRFADYVEMPSVRRWVLEDSPRLNDIGTIFHLGAISATTEKDASLLIDNNYASTKELAAWSLRHGVRFVYASSAATYGDGAQGMSDEVNLATLRPLNMYGYSKHLFDLYAQRGGFLDRIVGLKYFNVFGPNETHKAEQGMCSLVHKAYGQVVETGAIRLFKSDRPDYADGEQMRDFLYVKDAVEMTIHLAETASAGGLYNLGSGEANTWNALATAIFAALGRAPRIEYIPMPEVLRAKYQYFTQADIAKLRGTGYARPITPLAEAVGDYVKNYLVPARQLGEEGS